MIVFLVIVFLCFPLLGFSIACFDSFKIQLLLGIVGTAILIFIAFPKTRRSIILKTDPVGSSDRIAIACFLGIFLVAVGATGFEPHSSIYSASTSSSDSKSDGEKERNKDQEKKYKQDVKEENKNQREFYSQLAAPKILYKCTNEDLEHAYGVNYGTYNRLLEKAIADCGEDNLKIIKNEK